MEMSYADTSTITTGLTTPCGSSSSTFIIDVDPEGDLELVSLGVKVSLDDIYADPLAPGVTASDSAPA